MIALIRFIWNNEPREDILFCGSIIRGTSEGIFGTRDTYVKSKELHWINCVRICTGRARAMRGKNSDVMNVA